MSNKEKKAQERAFNEMLKETGGRTFIGLVHHMYGPLRGLNFILKNSKQKEVFALIEESWKPMAPETQLKMIERMRTESGPPKTIHELIFRIWDETHLSTQPQILPFELVEEAENTPEEVDSIEEGLRKVNQNLALTAKLQEQDPFFFRIGII